METFLETSRVIPHIAALAGAYALALPIGWERQLAVRSAGLPASVHVCLIATFDDAEALKRYQAHPVHQAVTERIGPLRKARHLLDYAVSDEAHTVEAAELSLVV